MRTVTLLGFMLLSNAILRAYNTKNTLDNSVLKFVAVTLVCCIIMDIIDFFRKDK